MKKMLALVAALALAGSLHGHHSLGNYDTTKAVRVKGTIFRFEQINPHSFIFLDERLPDGQNRRWAVEGPSVLQLNRTGFPKESLRYGIVVEVCGYAPKEPIVWQVVGADPANTTSVAGRLLNGELLITADGKQQSWGDYGVHKCFEPGYSDQHSK